MMLIKLGGSAITDKKKLRTFRDDAAKRLLEEIKESGQQTILVHGAGSFGHILASKYELQKGFLDKNQIEGISKVQADVRELNLRFLRLGDTVGLSPVSIPPAATVICDNKEIISFNTELYERCLDLGLTPVTFGDVVFDSKLRFCICSGDDLMLQLSDVFHPEKAIFVADTDGIYNKNPAVHDDAKLLKYVDKDALKSLKAHATTCELCSKGVSGDATGGLLRKIEIMLKISQLGVETILLNGLQPSRLKNCISGKEVLGTIVK